DDGGSAQLEELVSKYGEVLSAVDVDFFFSSRRRHTRSKRDWSSDVCSSDLAAMLRVAASHESRRKAECQARSIAARIGAADRWRSEERRVGKECRARRSADH